MYKMLKKHHWKYITHGIQKTVLTYYRNLVFTFFQKKGRVEMVKKGTFVRQKGALVR